MNNELHFCNSKKALDLAKEKLDAGDYDTAIALLASAYSDVRQLMEHAWNLKREKVLAANPPSENTR